MRVIREASVTYPPNGHMLSVRPLKNLRVRSSLDTDLIGDSDPMCALKQLIEKVAPCQSTTLISGESGTGKELVARAIHNLSARADKPFIPVNCGAIPEPLIESELFGFAKGGFTGATANRKGLFGAAQGGTIFLDELGEMPPASQVKLLRVLQERKVRPVGASDGQEIDIDVRVIAATNKQLQNEVREGRFRQDLYFRINVFAISVPPLRERRSDIPGLTQYLLNKVYKNARLSAPARIDQEAVHLLCCYDWPGNVRELENVLESLSVLSGGSTITVEAVRGLLDIQQLTSQSIEYVATWREGELVDLHLCQQEIKLYRGVLALCGGSYPKAASKLKLKRTTLYKRVRTLEKRLRLAVGV